MLIDDDHQPEGADSHAEPGVNGHKGIYLLPNLLTTGTLFGGFYAILAGMHEHFEAAAIAIFAAMFFDGLDGRVARMTHTQSEFGVQYDSLSDMVAFGIAPAVLVYSWGLHPLGKLGWAVAFLFAACAALRLARFNVQSGTSDRKFFVGLASPPAAALLASMAWSGQTVEASVGIALLPLLFTTLAALLMVSHFRYYSFKDIHLRHRVPFFVVLGIVVAIAVVTIDPPRVLLLMALTYAASGPVLRLRDLVLARRAPGNPAD